MKPHFKPGHSYNATTAHDNARVHMGDVYNYADSNSEEGRVLEWLTPIDPSRSHDQACKQYQEGTLGWFFADPRFQRWRDGPEQGTTLWCRGNMGTGKTTLCAQILRNLQATGVLVGDLAVVYSRYTERNLQTAEAMLGSILAQLFQKDGGAFNIPQDVRDKAMKQPRFWTTRPTLATLLDWLQRRLQVGSAVFILLDAVDEMDHKSRRALLSVLSSTQGKVRLLVTSRAIPEIAVNLSAKEEIEIRASAADLQAFTLAKLTQGSTEPFKRLVFGPAKAESPFQTIAEEISFKIVQSAQDM